MKEVQDDLSVDRELRDDRRHGHYGAGRTRRLDRLVCMPHFDSPSVFARILDEDKGGHFSIAAADNGVTCKQLYWPAIRPGFYPVAYFTTITSSIDCAMSMNGLEVRSSCLRWFLPMYPSHLSHRRPVGRPGATALESA
ncbi:trehalase-like domain-containing protein [Aurantimonas sp. A3-2-R12]|uniref:trehalase-like domain-containing protein n=1 Tax=Aurantimonas sp. A3-2-R12 TaxID=3114362 RepID=UPI002E1720DB|nr:trehalase-like domain-containing protein [Aurantimonas sp. A3-2-R12]